MKRLLAVLMLLVVGSAAASKADERALSLPIGDPARSGREVPIVLDAITDTATGDLLTPPDLAERLDGVRILFVGESHTEMEFHRAQLQVIRELHRRGRTVIVGLEMYPAGARDWLGRWISDPKLTEERFLEESHWYRSWGHNWGYYRDIFHFARRNGIRMVGVNVPRDVVQTVRRDGFEGLTPEQKALLPERVDIENAEHERLFRAFFGEEDSLHGNIPEPMFQGMFRAQCTWDAAMGWNAVKALEASDGGDVIVVVLVGSGHVAYGLGAERQARLWFDGRTASLIPVPIADRYDPEPVESVQASYANFVWGLPPVTDPLYPTLGVSTPERKKGDRYTVIMVAEDAVGAAAGFQVGDELVSMDGVPIDDKETSRRMIAEKRWGDVAVYEVLRDGAPVTLTAHFRRQPPKPPISEAPPAPDSTEPAHPPPSHPPMPSHHGKPPAPEDQERPHHSLKVALDPGSGRLRVVDLLRLPPGDAGEVQFLLSAALTLTGSEPEATEVPLGDAVRFFGINASAPDLAEGQVKRYRVPAPEGAIRLEYEGPFNFGLSDQNEEYTRGFRETRGIVSSEGVYLAGSGFWYPQLGPGLVEFDVEVELPEGWHVVSQGNGTSRDADGLARWDSHGPMDEIYLVGGPLEVYRDLAGAVDALVYLRQTDDALAARYLEATAQYIEMYRGLIGPYPYGKFALVENFWETGYGMPSFTLLGPRVIRFPFILASSYPHEILHNWWGNSVFVDYETGNWCEGLTAYMADNLIKEQRGQGAEYRRDTLQKYRSYVRDERDFPLTEFRSRHSAATEAVGYGKTMMGFHMLRRRLGDDTFREWTARFYQDQRGRKASFSDVRESLEAVSGEDLGRFFADWVERPGAATLEVSVAGVRETPSGGWQVEGTLQQSQAEAPYLLDVPVVLQAEGAPVTAIVRTEGRETGFVIGSEQSPLALHVDPAFDVFRRLDPRETPPSIGQIFGEPRILAILPSAASAAEIEGYRELVEGWGSDSHQPEILSDGDLTSLPADRAVWLLGRENALALSQFASADDFSLDEERLAVAGESVPLADHAVVLVRRHPHDLDRAVGWIFADRLDALPGLGRKLPHYGKYSYLAFEGDEPTNVLKGQWTPTDSPLRVDLRPESGRGSSLAALALPAREALAELPPVFSQKALMEHVAWLAAPEREGRGIGTAGLDAAADYIAEQFQRIGLEPGGDDGSFFQSFETTKTPDGRQTSLRNVVGLLPGTNPEWAEQSALLTAHYDHLGRGWPDVHSGDEGQVHPGADDNASGVAVLLELARALAAAGRSQRTIVFVAFTGEEAEMIGSRHYVESPVLPVDQIIGVINLDTVGRLGDRKVSVLASGTASEWPHIFRGASYVTGVESRMIPEAFESSDQKSFIEKGVPAVQIFTDAHPDYHRPGDTPARIDGPGLVKVATFVKEGLAYLGERPDPLTVTLPSKGAPAGDSASRPRAGAPHPGGASRRVSFGTVPEFAFPGPGVEVASVVPGSPAEEAGVKGGDVLLRFAGEEVKNLRAYSAILKRLEPGQTVTVVLDRGGEEHTIEATLAAR